MASSGSVFSATLQEITTTKLEELAKQRAAFEKAHNALLAAASAEKDPLKRLSLLLDGAKSSLGVMTAPSKNNKAGTGRVLIGATTNGKLEVDLKNLDRFLEQARYDPSVSPKVLEEWEKAIMRYLSVQSAKYQYADLYGRLVTEWLSSEKDKNTSSDGDVEMGESFEELPGAKKLEARTKWEKVVFEAADVNIQGVKNYLNELFSPNEDVAKAFYAMEGSIWEFEATLAKPGQFNVFTLRWVIQGLQASDLLSNEKREVLKDFLSNEIILTEIADVLNMRMKSLDRWTWGDHVPLEERRMLNGGYSIHMHEDLLQAIFLQYIGIKWSVFFKGAFKTLREQAWMTNHTEVPKNDRLRRQYYLGLHGTNTQSNLVDKRARTHRNTYFAHQLLDHDNQKVEMEEGEQEAEFEEYANKRKRSAGPIRKQTHPAYMQQQSKVDYMQQMQQMPYQAPGAPLRQQAGVQMRALQGASYPSGPAPPPEPIDYSDEGDEDPYGAKRPMEAKQRLLHILSTEIVINTRLYGELHCFRSVFESWNPLLPHETILTVLEFFGVSQKWLDFFKTFLQAPLKFTDNESSEPRLRRRGTPGSHVLSDVFGEVVLGCLDLSVNQATEGGMLYRLYDDIWFWSKDYRKCSQAWDSVTEFTTAMGVKLNDSKTGSVHIGRDGALPNRDLLGGEIRWGFLYLDASSGRFEVDEKMVDSHIEELRKQLGGKSKSVIDWIQAWNTYAATFFSSNFGKAANCFGRAHVDKMLATHRRIQEKIFDGSNVVQFLKQTIEERFAVKDIPDGFLFFPVELGGLDLKSPFVGLLQIRESVKEDPHDFLIEYEEKEREDYATAKSRFDKDEVVPDMRYSSIGDQKFRPQDPNTFLPFDEFVRYREEYNVGNKASLVRVFNELLKRPTEESIDLSVQVKQAIEQLRGQGNLRGITSEWQSMEPYWKWVAQMYGPEMVARFNGLAVVELGNLPIGMVSIFRQKRIKWQG